MRCDHEWVLLGHWTQQQDAVRCRYCGIDDFVECEGHEVGHDDDLYGEDA